MRPNTARTRGRAGADKQLGTAQRQILLWLLAHHEHIQSVGSKLDRDEYQSHGVAWFGVAKRLGLSSKAATTALRGPGRSLLERGLVSARTTAGQWARSPHGLTPSMRVAGLRLTPAGVVAAGKIDPQTLRDIDRQVAANVERIYTEMYGPQATWPKETWLAYQAQVDEATKAHQSLAPLFRRRHRR